MLLNAVIIVLREVLEASLVISVFLALSQLMGRNLWWVVLALVAGVAGGYVYAGIMGDVSMLWDGTGQEVVNGSMHSLIFLALLVFMLSVPHRDKPFWHGATLAAIVLAVVVAIVREGSEIILYISGFSQTPTLFNTVLTGSAVGAGIGISVGIFVYYLLVNLPTRYGLWLGYVCLFLVAGNMVSQATEFMIQADIISSGEPLWDTSFIVNESSVAGQLLYALIGYESTPAPQQVVAYLGSISLLIVIASISYFIRIKESQ